MRGCKDNNCHSCGKQLNGGSVEVFDTRFGISKPFYYVECRSCNMSQIDPIITNLELKEYYERYYNSTEKAPGVNYSKYRQLVDYSWLGKIIYRLEGDVAFYLKTGTGPLLEIGCNEGRNLPHYQNNGFQVEGLEINSIAANIAARKGFNIHSCYANELTSVNRYSVVVLSNVLEHDTNPNNLLKDAYKIIKKNGELWISLPNYNSIWRHIFKKNWINWHPPFHVSHFSPSALESMLIRAGFSIREVRTVSPSQWISMSIISTIFFTKGIPTRQMRNVSIVGTSMLFVKLITLPFNWLINKLLRGDCIKIVAVKDEREE